MITTSRRGFRGCKGLFRLSREPDSLLMTLRGICTEGSKFSTVKYVLPLIMLTFLA
jgi:hypothetical protein